MAFTAKFERFQTSVVPPVPYIHNGNIILGSISRSFIDTNNNNNMPVFNALRNKTSMAIKIY